ncbi:MAG: SusC/RagA family TonB-linked outer membrane protein [Gemmatimonadaceae bacterium]
MSNRIVSPRAVLRFALAFAATASLGMTADPLMAQAPGRIEGRVVEQASQQPLIGVSVVVERTNMGALTGEDGRYTIANVAPGSYELRARRIGFGSSTADVVVSAGGVATANFSLTETAISLEEIVVTGTAAEVRAKEVGTSLATVSATEIENIPITNAQDILAGRVTGVTFMQSSGQPGSGSTIKIRGVASVSQDVEPLLYVDGIRIFNQPTRAGWGGRAQTNPLQDINPEDIERIEIVKGAAATTLYGTEASSGVIQIFTKRGSAGPPVWNAEITAGVLQMGDIGPPGDPSNLFTECGNTELMFGLATSGSRIGERQYFVDPTCPADGNWFQPGPTQSYNLSVRGGAGRVNYYLSGNYGDAESFLPGGGSRDGGFRGNFGFAPNEELSFQLNTSYIRRYTNWVGDGNNAEGFLLNVGRGHRNYLKGGKGDDCAAVPDDVICVTNAYMFDQTLATQVDHFTSGFTTMYSPIAGLSNRFSVGWDYNDIYNETTLPFGFLTYEIGYYWPENTRHTKLSLDYAGSYENMFGENFASTFSWGGQVFRDLHKWTEIDIENFAGPGKPTIGSGSLLTYRDESRIAETNAGFFLQELFGWQDRLFVTAGLRVDGNSAFGDEFGLQTYPKLSVAYVLSDYAFWPTDWFETFKLRAAIGESGKAPAAFDKLRTWTSQIGDEDQPGFTPLDIGNSNLGPERTRETELGFDASLLAGRIGLEVTAFRATTLDALVGILLPPSQGFLSRQTQNVGTIENEGLEMMLSLGAVRTDNIDLHFRTTASWLRSDAVDLGGQDVSADNKAAFREGFPAPTYFGARIMNPDAIADPVIASDVPIGDVFPNQLFGLGTTLTLWNDLSLDALVERQAGHYLPNYTGYQNARRGAWRPCYGVQQKLVAASRGDVNALDDVTALQRGQCALDALDGINGLIGADSDFWVESADFTKLRHIALTYNIPAKWTPGMRTASVTLAGRNLYTWTDYTGTDPEVEDFADRSGTVFDGGGDFGRRDYYTIPPARSYTVSFRVSF